MEALTDVRRFEGCFADEGLVDFGAVLFTAETEDDALVVVLLFPPALSASTLGARISTAEDRAGTNIGADGSIVGVSSG